MATILNNEIITSNTSSLVNILNNAFRLKQQKKAFRIRGICKPGKGVNYSGFYITHKHESSDSCVTLIVPGALRSELTPTNNRVHRVFNEEGTIERRENRCSRQRD
jgi:hypothetical protein